MTTTALTINEYERRAIVSGLRRLRSNILQLRRRDDETGWTPEEGRQNVHDLRLATVDRLLARLESVCVDNHSVQEAGT